MELKEYMPPKTAMSLFRWYCRPDRHEELSGDIEEMYALRRTRWPKWKADVRLWWDVLTCYRAYSRKSGYFVETSGALYVSYLKLALRKMSLRKGQVLINVAGMGFAMAFCMVTYMFYAYNLEFDSHFDSSDLFRVHAIRQGESTPNRYELTPLALEQALKSDHSAVEDVVSYLVANISLGNDTHFFPATLAFVSPSFPQVFDVPVLEGSAGQLPLQGLLITKRSAEKLFGAESPVGKTLRLFYFGQKMPDVQVVGVIDNPPANSSFNYEGLLHLESLVGHFELDRTEWASKGFQFGQYVKLSSATRQEDVDRHLQSYVPLYNEANGSQKITRIELVPFANTNMTSADFMSYTSTRISMDEFMIYIFLSLLILLVACSNLANTHISQMAGRTREIGVRKTIGSSNRQIFVQFMFEMLLTMAASIVVALALTNIVSRQVWDIYGLQFLLQDLDLTKMAVFATLFLLVVTLITGLIPALYARSFQPVTIINHKLKLKGLGPLHYLLAVAQYTFSIALLVSGLSFMTNTSFMAERDFGYDPDNLLVIRVRDAEEMTKFRHLMNQQPFTASTFESTHYLTGYSYRSIISIDGLEEETGHYQVGPGYLTHMGVKFDAGRDFMTGSATDLLDHVVVNQQLADKYFGGDALHREIQLNGKTKTIIGVVRNYQDGELFSWYESLPLVYTAGEKNDFDFLFVRTHGEPQAQVLAQAESLWSEQFQRPMVYHWQNEYAYSGTVESSKQLRDIFFWLTAVAFALSIFGVVALAGIQVSSRTREISIRKILGASVKEIVLLINKPFVFVLSVAVAGGVGLGYVVSETILDSIFFTHQGISMPTGAATGLLVAGFALLVVTLAIRKPANANPANGLRTE